MRTLYVAALALFGLAVAPQQPQPFRGVQSYPVPARGDDAGYVSIFDGKTLAGWQGDPKYWCVENGALVGEVTPETLLKVLANAEIRPRPNV